MLRPRASDGGGWEDNDSSLIIRPTPFVLFWIRVIILILIPINIIPTNQLTKEINILRFPWTPWPLLLLLPSPSLLLPSLLRRWLVIVPSDTNLSSSIFLCDFQSRWILLRIRVNFPGGQVSTISQIKFSSRQSVLFVSTPRMAVCSLIWWWWCVYKWVDCEWVGGASYPLSCRVSCHSQRARACFVRKFLSILPLVFFVPKRSGLLIVQNVNQSTYGKMHCHT